MKWFKNVKNIILLAIAIVVILVIVVPIIINKTSGNNLEITAKSSLEEKKAQSGITHLFEKDRTAWIEYTGVAKVGIDMSKVDIKVSGDKVKITIPPAEVLSTDIDNETLNKDSYIYSVDSSINKNEITAQDQTQAINNAQENMKKSIESNSQLLLKAQDRAKELIKNYVSQFNNSGKEYKIEWVELKESM